MYLDDRYFFGGHDLAQTLVVGCVSRRVLLTRIFKHRRRVEGIKPPPPLPSVSTLAKVWPDGSTGSLANTTCLYQLRNMEGDLETRLWDEGGFPDPPPSPLNSFPRHTRKFQGVALSLLSFHWRNPLPTQ